MTGKCRCQASDFPGFYDTLQTSRTKLTSFLPLPSAGCIRGRGFQSSRSQQAELHRPRSWTSPCLPPSSPLHRQRYLLLSFVECKIFVDFLFLAEWQSDYWCAIYHISFSEVLGMDIKCAVSFQPVLVAFAYCILLAYTLLCTDYMWALIP
jgi:hypothetical protein